MKHLLLFYMLVGCAYGMPETQTKTYGHSNPSLNTDASPPTNDSNNIGPADNYETGCIVQNIFGNGYNNTPTSYVLICDGQPFNVNDIIDPPIDGKQK